MAGRQRLRQREERSEPVRALLGIGPGSLPPPPLLFPSAAELQLEPSAKAGVSHCPSGTPLPSAEKTSQAAAAAMAEPAKRATSPRAATLTPLPPHLCPSPRREPQWPPYPGLQHRATLPEICPGQKTHKAPASLQALGEIPSCPPRTPKHNPCRNTASTRPAQAETMIFCFCFRSCPTTTFRESGSGRRGKEKTWKLVTRFTSCLSLVCRTLKIEKQLTCEIFKHECNI